MLCEAAAFSTMLEGMDHTAAKLWGKAETLRSAAAESDQKSSEKETNVACVPGEVSERYNGYLSEKMTDSVQKDIRDLKKGQGELKKGQDTIMEILDGMAEKQDHVDTRLGQFDARLGRLEAGQINLEKDMSELKEWRKGTDAKLDTMMGHLDYVVGELQRKRTEELAGSHLIGQHGQQLIDHNKRITTLEKAAA